MNFRNQEFLRNHIKEIISFYHPKCLDNELGGYIHQFRDDGSIDDQMTKHLVGTCRFIYTYSVSFMTLKNPEYREAASHGLKFLQRVHQQPDGGFAWILHGKQVEDDTRFCYGHAFVLLAAAVATKAKIDGAREFISEVYDLLENRFWEERAELYSDEMKKGWKDTSPYRGQNANMHMCEAMLSAFEATKEEKYLDRAYTLAKRICLDLAKTTNGLIWEHFKTDWLPDWDYNKYDPKHMFKPYGYILGHSIEWSKLLLILERYRPESWMLETAKKLFDNALEKSWDQEQEGMHYTLSPNGKVLDSDRYYWVLAETFAAAALMALRTKDSDYWNVYDQIWEFSNRYFVDHKYGGWFRILNEKNQKYDNLKSPPSKADYHPIGACYETLEAMNVAGFEQ
mgnify:FL=1